uniref:DNA-(apurinic or apyrimidinic site) lyase n=1 Tax=Chloropicon roscoffensis TaxID=1461544 RepID=A0A7S3FNN1_9CHLO
MVEGHGVHRVAQRHRRLLLGKVFKATSPNGRFAQGAKLIDDRTLSRIEAIGKNLFYFWGDRGDGGKNTTVVHIHFGMSGQFKTAGFGKLEATKNTRLELASESDDIVAHLSAMTVNHGDMEFYDKKVKALGQDPLREDADADLVWEAFKKSRKSVGALLMDQSVIAGLGNIYRAEVLFKAGLHPETPGASIDHETFTNVWQISKDFLRRGVETGSILTVEPQEAKVLGPPWTRRYIYNHSQCGRCGTRVKTWDMAGRTVYACVKCQPLESTLDPPRKKQLAKAKGHVPFVSHCAPEPRQAASALDAALEKVSAGEKRNVEHVALVEESTLELAELSRLKVKELKTKLSDLDLPTSGKKEELLKRLVKHRPGKIPFKRRR